MTTGDSLEQIRSDTLANDTPLYWVEKKSKKEEGLLLCAGWCTKSSMLVGPFNKHLIQW